MTTQPTNLPVPSESPRDLKFNAGKIDEFVTSQEHTYTDRFGVQHWTISGIEYTASEAISKFGYITLDSFEDGNTLTLPNQVLRLEETGEYYRWDGGFPKDVQAGSTPESTGGIGIGAWIGVGDASLRSDINNGYLNPQYFRVYQTVADMRAGNLKAGDNVTWNGYYAAGDGGGNSGVVVSGSLVADEGSIFALSNGLYVVALFNEDVDPLQFGVSGIRTSAQNKTQFDFLITFSMNNRKVIRYHRAMDYQCDPIVINGTTADWFTISASRGSVTHRCPSTTTWAFILQGTRTTATDLNSFQYCTIDGLRIISSYGCIYTRNTENLVIQNCLFNGGSLGSATGRGISMSLNGELETDIKPRIRHCIFGFCKHAIHGQSASITSDRGRVADAMFEDLVALNCGELDGDFVYQMPYLDGAILNKVEVYQDANNPVGAGGILLQKPSLVNLTNCNVFEVMGYGIQLSSPRGVTIDSTNTIQGAGETANRAALAINSLSASITTQNVQLSPRIRECYGPAVQIIGVNNIDLSGLEEYNNCLGSAGVGWAIQNSQNIRIHNVRADSLGSTFLNVDASSVELFNPNFLRYSSQISLANSGNVLVLPGQRVLQVTAATTPGGIVDEVQYNASSGSAVITLPSAVSYPGKLIRIVKTDSSANGVGIFPASGSGQLINGAASLSLTTQYQAAQLRSTGANWIVVARS